MTNSFKVKPQRQIRDLVADPERPQELARPAAPLEIPQQVGGQLIDRRAFLPNPQVQQALQSMQTWSGVAQDSLQTLGEERQRDAQKKAEALLEQEAFAFEQSIKNATDVEKLKARKKFKEARYAQLRNPYINFHYYNTKATDAGKIVSTKLAKWGQDNAENLAIIEDPGQRSAQIAAQADELMKPYADLPQNFIAGKIDPLLASTKADIQKLVANAELNVAEEKINQTTLEAINGQLELGFELGSADGTTPQGTKYQETAMIRAYQAGYQQFVILNGKSERDYNEWFYENIGRVFVDKNANSFNDLSENYGIRGILQGLEPIVTKEGVKLLDLTYTDKNGNKTTMRQKITDEMVKQLQKREKIEQGELNDVKRRKAQWGIQVTNLSHQAFMDNPEMDQTDIDELKAKLREELVDNVIKTHGPGSLPYSREEAYKQIDKLIPNIERPASLAEEAKWEPLLQEYKDNKELTELPPEFVEEIAGTDFYGRAIKEFYGNRKERRSSSTTQARKTITDSLSNRLKIQFTQDKSITTDVDKDIPGRKSELLKQAGIAYDIAKPTFEAEVDRWAENEYLRVKALLGDGASEKEIIDMVIKNGEKFFDREEYSNIQHHVNIDAKIGTPEFGTVINEVRPLVSEATGDGINTPYDIKLKSTDAGYTSSWAAIHRPVFINNEEAAIETAKNTWLFDTNQFNEINAQVATGDPNKLSDATRKNLGMLSWSLGIPTEEVLRLQVLKYNNGKPPIGSDGQPIPNWEKNLGIMGNISRPPAASTGDSNDDNQAYIYDSNVQLASGDNGIVWESRKGNQVQSRNTIPAPFGGKVVFAGPLGDRGEVVVIEAERDYPAYNVSAGDQVVTSHLAWHHVNTGDRVERGMSMGLSGDRSEPGSDSGYSSTGSGIGRGQIHTQLFRKGGFEYQGNQYSQGSQKDFWDKAYTGLYS